MKRNVLIVLFVFAALGFCSAQVYLEQFEADVSAHSYANTGMSSSFAESEWTISADGSSGPYETFGYMTVDDQGSSVSVDMTETNKIFVRVKASSVGTQLRMDIKDVDGFVSSIDNVTKTVLNDYEVLVFEYTSYEDGGYGGTSCDAGSAPCPVDGTQIAEFIFYINPGQGGYQGTVILDYISVGTEPNVIPMSDVYQEDFDTDSVKNYIDYGDGYSGVVADGLWTITGDGTAGPWNPMVYFPFNKVTFDSTDIDLTLGENKIFIRAKGNVSGISLRCDAQDIDGFITTSGSVTKVLTDEWATYTYDLTGFYEDIGYGGTPCTEDTAPCAVDPTRIGNFTFFMTPGVEGFAGEVQIEYISIGTALEPEDPTANVLVYGDHFNDGINFGNSDAFTVEEADSKLTIIGDGNAAAYAAVAYSPNDMDTGEAIAINVTGNNKIFVKGNSTVANTLVRMDLIDGDGFVTSMPALTRVFGTAEGVYEYDFSSVYVDAGYGGTACETGPCPVDATNIVAILLYPDPADGMFNGTLSLDYISVGAPLGEDIGQYKYQFDNDINVLVDPAGFVSAESGEELVLTGDGSAGAYAAYAYDLHDQETGASILADFTLNDKLYIKAKSDVDGAVLRIDVIDELGYVGNLVAVANSMTTDYVVYEYDYSGGYQDGAYGGTPCTDGPCDVDATRVNTLLLYLDPDAGGFSGNVTIDWISTQMPLETIGSNDPLGQDDYADDFLNGNIENITGAPGLELSELDGLMTITGDGTGGMWTPVVYNTHDQSDETVVSVNASNNDNLLYIRAKSSVADLPMRVDIQDIYGYVTSFSSIEQTISDEWTIYSYDYSGKYQDGGFGGTPCTAGPCDVDPLRIASIQMFLFPGVGAFNGVLDIDWISFGEPLVVNVVDYENVLSAKIYPNPSAGNFVVDASFLSSLKDVNISMFDISGRLLYTKSASVINNNLNHKVEIDMLNEGIYFLQVSSSDGILFNEKVSIK